MGDAYSCRIESGSILHTEFQTIDGLFDTPADAIIAYLTELQETGDLDARDGMASAMLTVNGIGLADFISYHYFTVIGGKPCLRAETDAERERIESAIEAGERTLALLEGFADRTKPSGKTYKN